MSLPPGEPAVLASSRPGDSPEPVEEEVHGGLRADGAACFDSEHCASNICEGASCDASRPGTCVPKDRPCTADLSPFCGCDGLTFLASSSCPGEAFEHVGECPANAPDPSLRLGEDQDEEPADEELEDEE